MTQMRRLNAAGVESFRRYLQQIREGAEFQPNPAILHVDDYSPRVVPAITIENRPFPRKLDAAEYLTALLAPLEAPSLFSDVGLWSWLALFYFDQLAPKDASGRRRPREDYHYIPSLGHGWSGDRHLLAGPCRIYQQHHLFSRLLLYPHVHEHGAFVYDLAFRREFMTNRGLIEAIDLLYWDAKRNRPKRGTTTSSRPGNLRRLITVLQQLDFNYDLYGMTAAEILQLLPAEFDAWQPPPLLKGARAAAREALVTAT